MTKNTDEQNCITEGILHILMW